MAEVHVEDYKQGRLLKSETITDEGSFIVAPAGDTGKVRLRVPVRRGSHLLDPEEAYWLGDALTNHAKEHGFDPSVED